MISSRAGDRKVVLRNVAVFGPREEDLEKLRGEESGRLCSRRRREMIGTMRSERAGRAECTCACVPARVCVCARA